MINRAFKGLLIMINGAFNGLLIELLMGLLRKLEENLIKGLLIYN